MSFLDHKVLQIIQGVAAVPGDSNSVENPLQVLNLMDSTSGISLAPDGWSPSIPGLENSGIWADSPLSNGRKPLVMQEANVTETMNLVISSSSFLGMTKTLAAINTMAINARAFWTDNAQYDPVYLAWWASCGKGMQYALIYNMDMKYEYQDAQNPIIEVTLTIERESYWRGIAPGANPKQWYYESIGQAWDTAGATLGNTSTADLVLTGTLQNKSEFSASDFSTLVSTNFITIPAASIPGDTPALINLYAKPSNSANYNLLFGKKTTKIPQYDTSGNLIAQNTTINCIDGTLGTNASAANDTGGVRSASSATLRRIEISFATATNQLRWSLSQNQYTINRFIGRWMVFLRCRQQGGTLGDITMYLRYGTSVVSDSDGTKLNVVFPPVIAGAGDTTNWGLVYMGIITSPISAAKADIGYTGGAPNFAFGLRNVNAADFRFGLFALRSAGAAPLYICDLVLIPVDEGSIGLETADATINATGNWYDETGYFTHGVNDAVALNGAPASSGIANLKVTGAGIQLTPGIENRLYYLIYNPSNQSNCGDTASFHLNIIPRWRGIRDV